MPVTSKHDDSLIGEICAFMVQHQTRPAMIRRTPHRTYSTHTHTHVMPFMIFLWKCIFKCVSREGQDWRSDWGFFLCWFFFSYCVFPQEPPGKIMRDSIFIEIHTSSSTANDIHSNKLTHTHETWPIESSLPIEFQFVAKQTPCRQNGVTWNDRTARDRACAFAINWRCSEN